MERRTTAVRARLGRERHPPSITSSRSRSDRTRSCEWSRAPLLKRSSGARSRGKRTPDGSRGSSSVLQYDFRSFAVRRRRSAISMPRIPTATEPGALPLDRPREQPRSPPSVFATLHTPLPPFAVESQLVPSGQSGSDLQPTVHAFEMQAFGEQSVVPLPWQLPRASQKDALTGSCRRSTTPDCMSSQRTPHDKARCRRIGHPPGTPHCQVAGTRPEDCCPR